MYKYGNIQIYMQKNKNVKNVKEYVKKVNIYTKNHKIISNRNAKSNKYIEMCIKIQIHTYIYIDIYICMYLCCMYVFMYVFMYLYLYF